MGWYSYSVANKMSVKELDDDVTKQAFKSNNPFCNKYKNTGYYYIRSDLSCGIFNHTIDNFFVALTYHFEVDTDCTV